MAGQPPKNEKVIVFGIAFMYPLAGVTFQFLHYLIGLRRLGYDVYYVEDCNRWVYVPEAGQFLGDPTPNIRSIGKILNAHGFEGKWVYRNGTGGEIVHGMSEASLKQLYVDADACLNVTGAHQFSGDSLVCKKKILVETDPVAPQIEVSQNNQRTIDLLAAHEMIFSFGENFYSPDCKVPLERFKWHRTRQPVVVDLWQSPPPPKGAYTTVGTWQNKGKDIVYNGETFYWSKDREMPPYLDLPAKSGVTMEMATSQDIEVKELLERHGWKYADCIFVSSDIDRYRNYIQNSRAEFTVAKDQNIRLMSGWFSDRSACYLAAGRPVITQETGHSNVLPTGKGLFGFRNIDDVLAAMEIIESDYAGCCQAAGDIAREYFAAEKVLKSLMDRVGA